MAFDAHVNPIETAWAAGLFEGEGCITVGRQTHCDTARVQMMLGMCDRDVVERFKAWTGVGTISVRPPVKDVHREFYYWQVQGHQTKPLLEALLPFFGERRGAKARLALEAVATLQQPNTAKTHCPSGHPYIGANIYWYKGSRRCRTCWKTRDRQGESSRYRRRVRARVSKEQSTLAV